MKIGTYYYPEQWPREQWERDFDNIAVLGLQIVHMGEAAWSALEPRQGEYDFQWLSDCVELAARRNLQVLLCTPTAFPPLWLIDQHPEILPVDDAGRRKRWGSPRCYSPTAPAMREAASRIVSALADRFANHPAIIGWQVDNHFSSDFIDQNDHALSAWHAWLRQRFHNSIEALNLAWGTAFTGGRYTDFPQIRLPISRDPSLGNPHQVLDASRFWSQAFADFNRLQSQILKTRVQSPVVNRTEQTLYEEASAGARDLFITTNFSPGNLDCNPADLAADLTLMSWNSYPCTGREVAPKEQHFRIGDPAQIGLMHDYLTSFQGRWGLTDLQPGHLTLGATSPHLYPGAIRLWLWTAFAHGAEFVVADRFRQARAGAEMFHHGLVGTDGITPSLGGREFQQTIDELARLDLASLGALPARPASAPFPATASVATVVSPDPAAPSDLLTPPAPAVPSVSAPTGVPAACVGLVFDFEQLWWFKVLPQSVRWSYERLVRLWYGALSRLGCAVKVLHPDQAWPSDLPLIVCPGLQMVDDAVIAKMRVYASAGGHLVLTCRTALMDRTGQFFDGPTAHPIHDLIGGTIEAYDGLPEGLTAKVDLDGKEYEWGVWGDLLYNEDATRILAKYDDEFYEGAAAVIQHKFEAGLVTYCGVFGEEAFTNALAEKLALQAKVSITPQPARVQLLRRGPYRILLNYTTAVVDAPAPPKTKFLVGTRKVEAAGVAVWKE